MQAEVMPPILVARIGVEGASALAGVLEHTRREWTEEVVAASVERFERRLTKEASDLRVEMARNDAAMRRDLAEGLVSLREQVFEGDFAVRTEIAGLRADLRQEMAGLRGDLRQEMTGLRGDLCQEMSGMRGDLRQEMALGRSELLKWSFAFWLGQMLVTVGVVGAMLRFVK